MNYWHIIIEVTFWKIDHKVKRIYQTFRNLKLFSNILNQNHGNYPLAPITLDGHKIYLNYKPTHFLSSRMLPNIVRETKYLNGDISYEYSNGSIIINTKKFKFIKYSKFDIFPLHHFSVKCWFSKKFAKSNVFWIRIQFGTIREILFKI